MDETAPFGVYRPAGRSKLAARMAQLPLRLRRSVGMNDYFVAAIDGLVTLCAIVIEEANDPLLDRLNAAKDEFAILDVSPAWVAKTLTTVSEEELTRWVKHLFASDGKKVLNRMLGTATYSAMAKSLDQDVRTILGAVQVGTG